MKQFEWGFWGSLVLIQHDVRRHCFSIFVLEFMYKYIIDIVLYIQKVSELNYRKVLLLTHQHNNAEITIVSVCYYIFSADLYGSGRLLHAADPRVRLESSLIRCSFCLGISFIFPTLICLNIHPNCLLAWISYKRYLH